MKVYKKSYLVNGNNIKLQDFLDELNNNIHQFQLEGLQIEVQYNSSQGTGFLTNYSALILAYTEE